MSLEDFKDTRADLQSACSASYPVIDSQVEGHCNTFIWQMDKGLEENLFGTPIEQAAKASLTADQVRRISRENGKKYSHACLAITPKILSLSSSIESLASGELTIQQELNAFRAIVERLAVLQVTYTKASKAVDLSSIKTFEDLLAVTEVTSSLIGTRFNWSTFQLSDFSEMPAKTDYIHNTEDTRVNLSAASILGSIDKLQKQDTYKGIRPFYNFCCEFVHPNIGDNIAATSRKQIYKTNGGQLAYKTQFSKNSILDHQGDGDVFVLLPKSYRFAKTLVIESERLAKEFGSLLSKIKRANEKFAHRVVKRQMICFSRDDFCPCGSGKTIRVCVFN